MATHNCVGEVPSTILMIIIMTNAKNLLSFKYRNMKIKSFKVNIPFSVFKAAKYLLLEIPKVRITMICLLLFSTVVSMVSCSSTQIVNSWRAPESMVSLEKLNKVLVTAFLRDDASRRVAEDQMVELLKGKAIASYAYIGEDIKSINESDIRERLKRDGFDGALVIRLIDVSKEVNYTPGNIRTYPVYFRTFGGYYRRGWTYYSTPERHSTTQAYSVETTVYSVKQDKLIWSGLTKTVDPSGVDKLITEIVNAVYKQMMKEGFITK